MKYLTLNLNLWLWLAVLGAALALEGFGLLNHRDYTLTQVIRTYIPVWLRAMVWGWLGYHFIIR